MATLAPVPPALALALALELPLTTPLPLDAQEELDFHDPAALPAAGESCTFVVYNRSEYALAVRVLEHGRFLTRGEMNPGELLTGTAPCAQGRVYVQATNIVQPWYPTRIFRAWGDLVEGERTAIWLQFPSRRYEPNVHAPRPRGRPLLRG
jgi:hypothetical protein